MKEVKDWSYLKRFGENLAKIRTAKGLSYRKMAKNCSIDHADIKKYETGKTNLSLLTLKDLAAGLDIEVKELLDF